MSRVGVSDDEQAAADAICTVVDAAHYERLEPLGQMKTPDWRVTLACGRVADVEVTTYTDGDALSFSDALTNKDGSPKVFDDERLSHTWDRLGVRPKPWPEQEATSREGTGEGVGHHVGPSGGCGWHPRADGEPSTGRL